MATRPLYAALWIDGAPIPYTETVAGDEGISESFTFQVRAATPIDQQASVDALVGKPAKLEVGTTNETCCIHGIVSAVEVIEEDKMVTYLVTLSSELHPLGHGCDWYVYQEMSAKDIISDVLESGGIASDHVEWRTTGSFPLHTYVAQCGESDLDFIKRVAAEDGIYFWFEHSADSTKIIFSDTSSDSQPFRDDGTLTYRKELDRKTDERSVSHVAKHVRVTTDKVRISDYNPAKPKTKLNEMVQEGDGKYEIYDYPGLFAESADGKARATRALEALRSARISTRGRTSTPLLHPGMAFGIDKHQVESMNGDYVCTSVHWQTERDRGLTVDWVAIPKATPIRPQPLQSSLEASGPQTGVMSGPSGKELYTDDDGNIRVQFYWDRVGARDEKASTFMRVGQFAMGGSMVRPRIGWDLMVEFHQGHAHQPFVLTHLYDGEHPTPYALPANKTRSAWQTATTPGGGSSNEIRFEDKKGSEEIFINASKDMAVTVGDNKGKKVGVDHSLEVGANQTIKVSSNRGTAVTADQETTIGAAETLTVSANRKVEVGGASNSTIGAGRTVTVIQGTSLEANGGRTLTVGASMVDVSALAVSRAVLGSASVTVGAAWVSAAATGLANATAGCSAETVGAAKLQLGAGGVTLGVKGALAETVGGAYINNAGGDAGETSVGAMTINVGGAFIANAPKIEVEAKSEITITCGGSSVTIKSGSIEVKSPSLASPGATIVKDGSAVHHNPLDPMATLQYRVVLSCDALTQDATEVTSLTIREEMGRPPTCEVRLTSMVGSGDVQALLRKDAVVAVLRLDTGAVVRSFNGLVTKVRERATVSSEDLHFFQLTIESPLCFLARSTDHKIFQEKKTKDIVSDVLEKATIPSSFIEWRLSGSYQPREVCTQWGETMLAFVNRLLEEDGIFYFTTHGDSPKLVFGDSSSAYEPLPNAPEIRYGSPDGDAIEQIVTQMSRTGSTRAAKVTFRDHDFKKPSLDLTVDVSKASPFDREHYIYPGRYVEPGEGKRLAQAMLDSFVAKSSFVRGRGQAFSLTAGHTFELLDGPAWSSGTTWVICSVVHEWRKDTAYDVSFDALPKDVPFRPLRLTPKPKVYGPQTATVTGPPGEDIHCDEFGRIKVQFTWDRHDQQDDKSSGWVRVGQMHTSGSVVIPRIGWEVLVDFEDGNPDRPIVIGRVYNAVRTPPLALPGAKTSTSLSSDSSPGGGGRNEIRMDDGGGAEVIGIQAEKDLNLVVANNKEEKVTTNATIGIASNQTIKVGASKTVQVGAKDTLKVGGAQKYSVGAARTKTISGGEQLDVTGARSHTIGATHMTMTPMSASCSTSGSLAETVGASCVEAAALGVSLAVAGSASLTIGAAKIEAVAAGKTDITVGARASTVGGALLNLTPKDVSTTTSGSRATTVGGAWLTNAGGKVELSTPAALKINVGGAVIMNGASVVFKVGGSTVTIATGGVVFDSSEVKFTATGPNAELAPVVGSKG